MIPKRETPVAINLAARLAGENRRKVEGVRGMRYREVRWPCEFPVRLCQGTDGMQATVINASSGGLRLRLDAAPEPGTVVSVDLGPRRIAATVRWCREGKCGLRLLSPLGKPELAMIRRGRGHLEAAVSGRWNSHLREMR
jgi:hypothetical protein